MGDESTRHNCKSNQLKVWIREIMVINKPNPAEKTTNVQLSTSCIRCCPTLSFTVVYVGTLLNMHICTEHVLCFAILNHGTHQVCTY